MEWIDFAIINVGISLLFGVISVSLRVPPWSMIPNALAAIGFYIVSTMPA